MPQAPPAAPLLAGRQCWRDGRAMFWSASKRSRNETMQYEIVRDRLAECKRKQSPPGIPTGQRPELLVSIAAKGPARAMAHATQQMAVTCTTITIIVQSVTGSGKPGGTRAAMPRAPGSSTSQMGMVFPACEKNRGYIVHFVLTVVCRCKLLCNVSACCQDECLRCCALAMTVDVILAVILTCYSAVIVAVGPKAPGKRNQEVPSVPGRVFVMAGFPCFPMGNPLLAMGLPPSPWQTSQDLLQQSSQLQYLHACQLAAMSEMHRQTDANILATEPGPSKVMPQAQEKIEKKTKKTEEESDPESSSTTEKKKKKNKKKAKANKQDMEDKETDGKEEAHAKEEAEITAARERQKAADDEAVRTYKQVQSGALQPLVRIKKVGEYYTASGTLEIFARFTPDETSQKKPGEAKESVKEKPPMGKPENVAKKDDSSDDPEILYTKPKPKAMPQQVQHTKEAKQNDPEDAVSLVCHGILFIYV